MKKIALWVFLGILVIGGLYYINKDIKKKEAIERIKKEQNSKTNKLSAAKRVDRNLEEETAVLISLKYNLDKDKIYHLINEYYLLVFGFPESSDYKPEENEEIVEVSVAIDNLSKKYNIPKETIANILLDKKALESKSSN